MNPGQFNPNSSETGHFPLELKPQPAWMAVLGLLLFTGLGIAAGVGNPLRFAFPLASLAVGIFLYSRYPIFYTGFTWWMWFLTPLATRLVDYRSGSWDEKRLMLLGPFLVTSVTIITVLKYLPKAHRQGGSSFVLALLSVSYGFAISIILNSPLKAARAMLDWLTPVLLGFYFFANWENYPQYRKNLENVFFWGTLVMGVYGIYQFLFAPEWDRFWLIHSEVISFGRPEPRGIRVWSTMQDPGSFAIFSFPGLLLFLETRKTLTSAVVAIGLLAFFLSMARTAWLGYFVALLIVAATLNPHAKKRLIINATIVGVLVFFLFNSEMFSDVIGARLQTFSNLEQDSSYNARQSIYAGYLDSSLSEAIGRGFGDGVLDGGVLDILTSIGWFGTLPLITAIILLLSRQFQISRVYSDSFMDVAKSIDASILVMLLSANTLRGPSGIIFWSFAGLFIAGYKYHIKQRNAR